MGAPPLRTVTEHRRRVMSLVDPLPIQQVPLADCLGRVVALDALSQVDLPGFDNSAMDGYAVRAAEVQGAGPQHPVALPVEGDIAAGDTRRHAVAAGRCLRIMTGAPLPAGADAVVPVEDSDGGASMVQFTAATAAGRHIRRRGEDVTVGERVLTPGAMLTPGRLALAAAAGLATLTVHRQPRVLVLSTGDELLPVGASPGYGQLIDSNGAMLAALVRSWGAEVVGQHHSADDADTLKALLLDPPGGPDLVLTTGGVSMGVYDTVKEVLTAAGDVEFVKVAMRPGMPQGSGLVGEKRVPIITLPGNPVSSFVSFHVFVVPVLQRLAGAEVVADLAQSPDLVTATALAGWSSVAGKTEFTRVRREGGRVWPCGGQGSHMLGALAEANALALVPADVAEVRAGDQVQILALVGHS